MVLYTSTFVERFVLLQSTLTIRLFTLRYLDKPGRQQVVLLVQITTIL